MEYIFRLDDITPKANWKNIEKIEKIFDKYWSKPIIWVVPNNKDPYLNRFKENNDFWEKIKKLEKKWWIIAQHWYEHIDITSESGILWINNRSEFVWLSFKKQLDRLQKWKNILENKLWIKIKWFMAPDHSFDKNTIKALKKLNFEYITDWLALYPFTFFWLKFLPQQLWSFRNNLYWIKSWYATICLHLDEINSNDEKFFGKVENFIRKNKENILSWNQIEKLNYKKKYKKNIINFLFKIYIKILLNWLKLIKKLKWLK